MTWRNRARDPRSGDLWRDPKHGAYLIVDEVTSGEVVYRTSADGGVSVTTSVLDRRNFELLCDTVLARHMLTRHS